jgi:hypothetical protein
VDAIVITYTDTLVMVFVIVIDINTHCTHASAMDYDIVILSAVDYRDTCLCI